MEEKEFVLLSRYAVRPGIHMVVDTKLQKEVRLEPRLMRLLCLLAKQPGQLVSREQLVKEIWNNYGGGEAGLNHAISSLRKLFNDTAKELIETIPTRGYILHAEPSATNKLPESKAARVLPVPQRSVIYASGLLIVACFVYFFFNDRRGTSKAEAAKKEFTVPFDEVNKAEETRRNTIVSIGNDNTVYKLKVVGDRRPEFYVNGKLLSPDDMEKHWSLINNLQNKLRERSK